MKKLVAVILASFVVTAPPLSSSYADDGKSKHSSPDSGLSVSAKISPKRVTNLLVEAVGKENGKPAKPGDPAVIRSRTVRVDVNGLQTAKPERGDVLELNLFDDVVFEAVIDRVERPYKAGTVYTGKLKGNASSQVTVAINEEVVIANIRTAEGELYQIRYAGEGLHEAQKIDTSKLPALCCPPLTPQQ